MTKVLKKDEFSNGILEILEILKILDTSIPNKSISSDSHYDLNEEEVDEILDMLYSRNYKNLLYNDDCKDS